MQNIVLLHGALGSARDLETLSIELNRNMNVYSFSFSGHGYVDFKPEFGIAQFSTELEEFILKKGLASTAIFGYSMGGYVALHLATKQSNLVTAIITLGTKFNWNKDAVEKETKLLNPELMLEKIPAYAKMLEGKHGPGWKEMVTKTAQMMKEISTKNYLNAESLKKINTRTLIGLADKDQMVSLEETIQVFKTLPNASMFMLPTTKHPIETVNTSLLSKLIIDFIQPR